MYLSQLTPLIYLHARQDLSRGEVNILLALSTLAGAPIFISQKRLAKIARTGTSSVYRHLNALKDKNLIVTDAHSGTDTLDYYIDWRATLDEDGRIRYDNSFTVEETGANTLPSSKENNRRKWGDDAAEPPKTTAAPAAKTTTKTTSKSGTRLPKDWTPSPELADWTRREAPAAANPTELETFRDYWTAQPGVRGRKLDWDATWRNWARRTNKTAPRRNQDQMLHDMRAQAIAWDQAQEDQHLLPAGYWNEP